MAPKQPSKQKRAAQNRNQRAARAARTANASTRPAATSAASGSRGGLLSRFRGGGVGVRPAGERLSLTEARALQPPGLRAALSAVFAAVAAIVLCTFMLRYPVDAQGDLYTGPSLLADWTATAIDAVQADPGAPPGEVVDSIEQWAPGRDKETVVATLWPWSLAILLPLAGAALALWAVRARKPSRVVNRALYATLLGAILTQGLLLLFLPVVLAVGVAMFQVRKAEVAAATADGIIDVDEVEDELDSEELDDDVVEAELVEGTNDADRR